MVITFCLSCVHASVRPLVHKHFQTTSSAAAGPILLKFHMEPPKVKGMKEC